MRIIAGSLKGRRLFTPADDKIRPTSDKVKESIFNIIAGYLEDAVFIDMFCGTGNIGIEAISRGAARCYFLDRSRDSIALTQKNIAHCKIESSSVVFCADYDKGIDRIREKADVIFLDPPYKSGLLNACAQKISDAGLLKPEGVLVIEHGDEEELSEKLASFVKIKEKRYGKIIIELFSTDTED